MNRDQRIICSALAHGAIFFSIFVVALGLPIAILFLSNDPVIKANARESINFHINMYIYGLVFGVLAWLLIGIPFLIILGIINFVMPIIAIFSVINNPDQPYRYPFIFRFLADDFV